MSARTSFQDQVESLQHDLLRMGVFVSEAIQKAVQSLVKGDVPQAQAIITGDDTVDAMMLDIEKRCLQLMALQQPMASDLRAIGTALKIVTDLERMADHATDIAKVTVRLNGERLMRNLPAIPQMAEVAQLMTREALEAYVHRDVERAMRMIAMDDRIDATYRLLFDEIMEIMQTQSHHVKQATYLLLVGIYLERIGDHATNLGEWTIYMVTGELKDLNQ